MLWAIHKWAHAFPLLIFPLLHIFITLNPSDNRTTIYSPQTSFPWDPEFPHNVYISLTFSLTECATWNNCFVWNRHSFCSKMQHSYSAVSTHHSWGIYWNYIHMHTLYLSICSWCRWVMHKYRALLIITQLRKYNALIHTTNLGNNDVIPLMVKLRLTITTVD